MEFIVLVFSLNENSLSGHDTYAAVGFAAFGRSSIFIVSSALAILWVGLTIAYFIIFADAATPLVRDLLGSDSERVLRTFVLIFLSWIIWYFWIKRELHELRIVSLGSTICAILFCITLLTIYIRNFDETKILSDYTHPSSFHKYFMTCPNVFLAYWFQQSFFTVYKSLEVQTDSNGWKILLRWFLFSTVVYLIVSLLSISLFGDSLKSDVLHNLADSHFKLRYACEIIFLTLTAFHAPIIFFVGKEACLILYCEAIGHLSTNHHHTIANLSDKVYYSITIPCYLFVCITAILVLDLGYLFAICGSFSATLIAFILPALFYLKLEAGKATTIERVSAYILLAFGCTVTFTACYSNLT